MAYLNSLTQYCRFLVINHDNLSSSRKIMEGLYAPQSFPQGSHGFSPSTILWREGVLPIVGALDSQLECSGLPGSEAGGRLDVGLPVTLLMPIMRSIRKSIQEIRDSLSSIELRLIGSSLLIVYEGDWDRAETGVQWLARGAEEMREEEEEGEWEEDEESEEEEDRSDRPCLVRLIDFAHTRLSPGRGPDLGVLKGLDTLLGLLDDRIRHMCT